VLRCLPAGQRAELLLNLLVGEFGNAHGFSFRKREAVRRRALTVLRYNARMELLLLGTAAAEGWPAPFCVCEACQEARRRGGPNLRARSGALVDDDLKIDFNADTVLQMQRTGRDLSRVRTLLFTHQHSDHIVPRELEWAASPFTNTPPANPIAVFGNEEVMDMIGAVFPDPAKRNLDLRPPLQPLQAVTTPAGDTVLPLPADHAPGALLLRVTRARDNKTLFYGHDSGLYPDATLAALADGPALDIALLDCTYGGQSSANRGHLGVDGVLRMVDELRAGGAITDTTRVVATHFSHNGGLLYEELVQAFLPHGVAVAFDGMIVRA